MPGTAEVATIWQATTYKSWRDVVDVYQSLIRPQRVLSPAMRRWVEIRRAK